MYRTAAYALAVSVVGGGLSYLAVRSRIPALPPLLVLPLMLALLAGIYLQATAAAFQSNETAAWLQQHPRGSEVLDEFAATHRNSRSR